MQEQSPSALAPRRAWSRAKLVAGTLALTVGALGAGLAATALPAYADVVSSTYTIGSPSPGVGGVTAIPASVTASASTNFQVMFTAASAISGSSSSWINLSTSAALASAPTNLALVANGCIQGSTAGTGGAGSVSTTGVLIYLSSTCNISAGFERHPDLQRRCTCVQLLLHGLDLEQRLTFHVQHDYGRQFRVNVDSGFTGLWRQYHLQH